VIIVPVEHLIDNMHTDITSTILHEINDLVLVRLVQISASSVGLPAVCSTRTLRKSSSILGSASIFRFRPPPGSRTREAGPWEILEVALPLADGFGIDAQDLGDVLDPSVAELAASTAAVPSRSFSLKESKKVFHGLLDRAGVGCHDGLRLRRGHSASRPLWGPSASEGGHDTLPPRVEQTMKTSRLLARERSPTGTPPSRRPTRPRRDRVHSQVLGIDPQDHPPRANRDTRDLPRDPPPGSASRRGSETEDR